MFQFTTTNVINSYQDFTTGLPLWSLQKVTPKDGEETTTLNIKRVNNFDKNNVVAIYKSEGFEGKKAKATLDFGNIDAQEGEAYRLSIYIRLSQSLQSSYYSNDMVFKGKPLSVEFNWLGDAAKTAAKLESIIKKYALAVYEKPIVKVTASGNQLIIEATDQYQRFHTVAVEKYNPKAYHGMGEYTPVYVALEESHEDYEEGVTGKIEQGVEGFGTYEWMLHNLRIPTSSRTGIFALNSDETPHAGALYNEYVIHYCKNRGILGDNAVGDVVKSLTTHVFYVNQALLEGAPDSDKLPENTDEIEYSAPGFEAALNEIAPKGLEEVKPNWMD